MTTTQVVETSFTVNNNSPIQDYVHPDDQSQPTFEMTPGFKPFTVQRNKCADDLDNTNTMACPFGVHIHLVLLYVIIET